MLLLDAIAVAIGAAATIPVPTSVDAVTLFMPPSALALLKLLLSNLWRVRKGWKGHTARCGMLRK